MASFKSAKLESENLLVIIWPESFGRFTFDLGPLVQTLLWSLILIIRTMPMVP